MISCDICKRFRQLRQRHSLAKKEKAVWHIDFHQSKNAFQ